MEARSLTVLNELAANPPRYPETPADKRQESLTLYIARVPGTRDVILSTLKPQERNVTGEDIANSLYYIHLQLPTHNPTHSEQGRRDGERRSSEESRRPSLMIPRKPVANQSRASMPNQMANENQVPQPRPTTAAVSNASSRESSDSMNTTGREPGSSHEMPPGAALPSTPQQDEVAPSSTTKPGRDRIASGLQTGVPARKPVGPRPMTAAQAADDKPAMAATAHSSSFAARPPDNLASRDNAEGLHDARNQELPGPPLETPVPQRGGAESSHAQSRWTYSQAAADDAPYPPPSPQKRSRGNGTPFALTVVRRDPSSGLQWNIGRVSSWQSDAVGNGDEQEPQWVPGLSSPLNSLMHPYPSINIELENSGYAKFCVGGVLNGGLGSPTHSNDDDRRISRSGMIIFPRQLLMEYSQSFARKCQKTYQRLEQTGRSRLNRRRQDSVASIASNISAVSDDVDVIATDGLPPAGMKPRGYVFSSPWGGKCQFRTGQGGRSLICQHTPHDAGTNYNPLVADHVPKIFASGNKTVSDLRFSLPSAEMFAERGEQWKGNFGKLLGQGGGGGHGHDDGHDQRDGAVSPFNVNLGSERAGGGSRGRRAKLGKLIVYDEGLKMLDLVVAANMGLWWRAWERNF